MSLIRGTRKERDIFLSTVCKLIVNMCKLVSGHDHQSIIKDISDLHIRMVNSVCFTQATLRSSWLNYTLMLVLICNIKTRESSAQVIMVQLYHRCLHSLPTF